MSKGGKGFSNADKARMTRSETKAHGQIRPGSFVAKVQSMVDTASAKPTGGTPSKIKS